MTGNTVQFLVSGVSFPTGGNTLPQIHKQTSSITMFHWRHRHMLTRQTSLNSRMLKSVVRNTPSVRTHAQPEHKHTECFSSVLLVRKPLQWLREKKKDHKKKNSLHSLSSVLSMSLSFSDGVSLTQTFPNTQHGVCFLEKKTKK